MVTNNQRKAIDCKQYLIFLLSHSRSKGRVKDEWNEGGNPSEENIGPISANPREDNSPIFFVVFEI